MLDESGSARDDGAGLWEAGSDSFGTLKDVTMYMFGGIAVLGVVPLGMWYVKIQKWLERKQKAQEAKFGKGPGSMIPNSAITFGGKKGAARKKREKKRAAEKAKEEARATTAGIIKKQKFCLCIEDDQASWNFSIVWGMSGKFMFVGYCLGSIALAVVHSMNIRFTFNVVFGAWIIGIPLPIQAPTLLMPLAIGCVVNGSLKFFLLFCVFIFRQVQRFSVKKVKNVQEEIDGAIDTVKNLGKEGDKMETADPASHEIDVAEKIQEKIKEKVEERFDEASEKLDEKLDETIYGGEKSTESGDEGTEEREEKPIHEEVRTWGQENN